MDERLEQARRLLADRPSLKEFEIYAQEGELHLAKDGESFIRLIPADEPGVWRMEYFKNVEEWQVVDFSGRLEDCLDYLVDYPHYRFWEG